MKVAGKTSLNRPGLAQFDDNVGMAVADICQDAGEVKWPGVESGSQR